VLGFEVSHHVPEVGWAELRSPVQGVAVGLTEVEQMPSPGGGAVLTFGVENVDDARARLEEQGVSFDGESCEIEAFVRLATLYDPDGNVLMLYQDLEG
jgi:predicted enzyme related to lactoylglutathione lyase